MRVVYLARVNSDSCEGRGPMVTVAAFTQIEAARHAIQGKGVMGVGDGDVEPLVVYDSFQEFQQKKHQEIRTRALAKLDDDEIEALGLRR